MLDKVKIMLGGIFYYVVGVICLSIGAMLMEYDIEINENVFAMMSFAWMLVVFFGYTVPAVKDLEERQKEEE